MCKLLVMVSFVGVGYMKVEYTANDGGIFLMTIPFIEDVSVGDELLVTIAVKE